MVQGPNDVFVEGLPVLRLARVARVDVERVNGASPALVIGRRGAWALFERTQRELREIDPDGIEQIRRTLTPALDGARIVDLAPLRLVGQAADHISMVGEDGETARLEHEPWTRHGGTEVAIDEAGVVWCAVPDRAELEAAESRSPRGRSGCPGRLVRWDSASGEILDDRPLCDLAALGYQLIVHPTDGSAAVSASFGSERRSWFCESLADGGALRPVDIDEPVGMSPSGHALLSLGGVDRTVHLDPRWGWASRPLLRVRRWPDLGLLEDVADDAVLTAGTALDRGRDGFFDATFLSDRTVLVESALGRLLVVDCTRQEVVGQLDLGYELGGGDRRFGGADLLTPDRLLTHDYDACYDIWQLPPELTA